VNFIEDTPGCQKKLLLQVNKTIVVVVEGGQMWTHSLTCDVAARCDTMPMFIRR
jgi:hypothetical protein